MQATNMYAGDYIRVLTPETTDGTNLRIVNDRVVYKESHLPFTDAAMRGLNEENNRLPTHLKHKIEIVHA